MDEATTTRLVQELVGAPGMELTLDTGYGAGATVPAGAIEGLDVDDGRLTLRATATRLRLDLRVITGAALVRHEDGAGRRRQSFHLTNRGGDDVLRAAFPGAAGGAAPAEQERFWTALAERHAGTPGLSAVAVTRRGPDGRVGEDVLLRCFAELRASGRAVFLLPGPTGSAEVFPNVPLLDPQLSGDGWLYAGEPHRRDVHLHVQVVHTARLRFLEERRVGATIGPAINYTVRFLDRAGRTQLYGSVAGSYTGPDGEVVTPSDGERRAFFGDLYRHHAAEAGVELAAAGPLLLPAAAGER
jgi:hypothetical protein